MTTKERSNTNPQRIGPHEVQKPIDNTVQIRYYYCREIKPKYLNANKITTEVVYRLLKEH